MGLRDSKMLKFFSILLFTFGLVAPVIGSGLSVQADDQAGAKPVLADLAHRAQFAQLLFEETSGEEEREFKAHKAQPSVLLHLALLSNVFDEVSNRNSKGYSSCPIQKLRVHPSLFRLYRTLII